MGTAIKDADYVTRGELRQELEVFGEQLVEKISQTVVKDISLQIDILGRRMHDELQEIREEMGDIRRALHQLTTTVDGFVKRLDDMDVENAARDAQYVRLLSWAKQVSKKTGIPLEY